MSDMRVPGGGGDSWMKGVGDLTGAGETNKSSGSKGAGDQAKTESAINPSNVTRSTAKGIGPSGFNPKGVVKKLKEAMPSAKEINASGVKRQEATKSQAKKMGVSAKPLLAGQRLFLNALGVDLPLGASRNVTRTDKGSWEV